MNENESENTPPAELRDLPGSPRAAELHGYAILWSKLRQPGSLVIGGPVRLTLEFYENVPPYASTGDGTLELFEDDFGLGFRARICERHRVALNAHLIRGSIRSVDIALDGNRIVDLALTQDERPSGCWRKDVDPDELPARIRRQRGAYYDNAERRRVLTGALLLDDGCAMAIENGDVLST